MTEDELVDRSSLRGNYVYGFKARAKKQADAIRSNLGLTPSDPLNTEALLAHLQLRRWGISELAERDEATWIEVAQLYIVDPSSFSGALISRDGKQGVLINDAHNIFRQRNTESHEAAHAILAHTDTPFLSGNKVRLRDAQVEAEADFLGRCLLIPEAFTIATAKRNVSAKAAARRLVIAEAAEHMKVSTELMQWAFNDFAAWTRADRSKGRR